MEPTKTKITTDDKYEIIKAFDNGVTKSELAKKYNVSFTLIHTVVTSPKRDKVIVEYLKDKNPEEYKKKLLAYKEMYGGW